MVDIDPAALSRPAALTTPTLKSITLSAAATQKVAKTSQIIPARIDLEPIYTALKAAIPSEQWAPYKKAVALFCAGRLNQDEYSSCVDPILASPDGLRMHLHNQLLSALYGNSTREIPSDGLAPWVSANDKPSTTVGVKPVTGDAAERKLKAEVMQVPARDRRRIKDLALNDADPYDALPSVFLEQHRARSRRAPEMATSASSGLNSLNVGLEIRKRNALPLASESGELPDAQTIDAKITAYCHEAGLANGHSPDAVQTMSVGIDTFLKEFLSTVFSRTRSNGPGDSGCAGFGSGARWIQTYRYRRQLRREEEAFSRGELTKDRFGLLPVEAKAASERKPLGIADLRLALSLGDCGLGSFPLIRQSIMNDYREGELEHWNEYSFIPGHEPAGGGDVLMGGMGNFDVQPLTHGSYDDLMDIDYGWEGAGPEDQKALDDVLDSIMATAS